jgi:hypothetical protein
MHKTPRGSKPDLSHLLASVGEWPLKFVTVSILKRSHNGRVASGTAVRRFQKRNGHLDPEVVKKICWDFKKAQARDIIVFRGGGDGRVIVIEICVYYNSWEVGNEPKSLTYRIVAGVLTPRSSLINNINIP